MTDLTASAAPVTDTRSEAARRAVKAFRAMQPTLTAYARALTRNPAVRVEVATGTNGATDGVRIFFRPPIELGEVHNHDRAKCDRRDENLQPLCPACRQRESVLATIYHEIAHICYDSFMPVTDQDRIELTRRAMDEGGTKFAKAAVARYQAAPHHIKGSYLGLAGVISPFLPILVNALEDARVNGEMWRARKGTKIMFHAHAWDTFTNGVPQTDGQIKLWRDYPLNLQIIVGVFTKVSGYDYVNWFQEKVVSDLNDPELTGLLFRMNTIRSASEVYNLAFKVLARLRQMGYCKSDQDPNEPEEEEKNADTDAAPEESQEPGEDGGPGPDESPGEADPSGDSCGSGEGRPGDAESDEGEQDSPESEEDTDSPDGSGSAGEPDESGDDDESGVSESLAGDAGGERPAPESQDESDSSESEVDDDSDGGTSTEQEGGDDGDSGDGDSDGTGGGEDDAEGGSDSPPDDGKGGLGTGDDVEQEGSMGPGNEGEQADDSSTDGGLDESADGDAGDAGPAGDSDAEGVDGVDPSRPGEDGDLDGQPDESDAGGAGGSETSSESDPSGGDSSDDDGADSRGDGGPESSDESDSGATPEEADASDSEVIDTGADQGEGGIEVHEEELPPMGDADEIKAAVMKWLGHPEQTPREARAAKRDEEEIEVAAIQGAYFETPSSNIRGVREHKYGEPDEDADGIRSAWGESRYKLYGYTRHQFGQDFDLDVPQTILGPALMRMRVAFGDNKRGRDLNNLKSGKVNSRALGKRVFTDDERLFKRRIIPGKKDYFVVIMMDISGSTVGKNIGLEKRAVMAQATLLNRMGIPFAVYGYSGTPTNSGDWRDRSISLDIYLIKEPDEIWNEATQTRLREIGPDSFNLDGHTLEYARKVCDRSMATNKVILYYSDGKMPAENHDEELEILTREIKTCKQKGYALLGVGIRTDSPSRHGLETVQVDDDADMIRVVQALEKRLLSM